jgi:hypothetical protein
VAVVILDVVNIVIDRQPSASTATTSTKNQ